MHSGNLEKLARFALDNNTSGPYWQQNNWGWEYSRDSWENTRDSTTYTTQHYDFEAERLELERALTEIVGRQACVSVSVYRSSYLTPLYTSTTVTPRALRATVVSSVIISYWLFGTRSEFFPTSIVTALWEFIQDLSLHVCAYSETDDE